jgi:hypothetical protein
MNRLIQNQICYELIIYFIALMISLMYNRSFQIKAKSKDLAGRKYAGIGRAVAQAVSS